ncbi:MAG TPA: YcjX family protein [Gemmataceae bacterium]|nr:YcjX family protein [Gemmataceae bacterium]
MGSLRWKTIERRIGVIGPRWSGKTVLLTALINHLKFHDPPRFVLGRRDWPGEAAHFHELPDTAAVRAGGGSLPWFDYEGYRNQLVQNGRWPATTRDASQYACRFERTDWHFSDVQLRLFDLPGERVNDIPMMTGPHDPTLGYAVWSDRTCRRLSKDLTASEFFRPYFARLDDEGVTEPDLIHAYKLALGRTRLAFRPYLTPSTFLLDRLGIRVKGTDPEVLAKTRYCGLGPDEEFAPLPASARAKYPEVAARFAARFGRYRNEVVAPVVTQLKSCHGLIVLIDVLAILGHGTGMYNDYRQLVTDLLAALDPKDTALDAVVRNVYEAVFPLALRRTWISRIAFVAPKVDRVPFEDRARVRGLMEQMVRHDARNCRGVKVEYFAVAAVVGAREVQGGHREMLGSTLYDATGHPLEPGAERKFSVSAVPDTWPEGGWRPGDFVFPDVYPRVSPLSNCPTEQSGLDDLFNFLCW